MFVLVLLLAVAGSGTAWWLYSRGDEELRQIVLGQLKSMAPTLKFEIARAHGELTGRVRLYGLTIRLPGDDVEKPSIEIPETVVTLDSQLMDLENIVVQKIRIVKPKIRANRDPDGVWNLQKIAFQPASGGTLPDIEIEHGSIAVSVQLPDRPSRRLLFKNFNVSAIPKDSRNLAIMVGTLLEPSGPLTLEIDVNLDGPTWECVTPEAWHIPVDSKLIRLLCDLSPQFEAHVANGERLMRDARVKQIAAGRSDSRTQAPMKLKSRAESESALSVLPDFGLNCDCGLKFRVGQSEPGSPLVFSAVASIENGKIENDLLPFPLLELKGKILVDNRQISVSDLRATNGPVEISVGGDIVPGKPVELRLALRGIEIDDDLKSRLPDPLRKRIVDLGLTGICDADVKLTQTNGDWNPVVDLWISRGTVTDRRFPVTVRSIVGELHLKDKFVSFNAEGRYARRPVKVVGTISNLGPEFESVVEISSDDLPLDDDIVAACPPPVIKTIESLRLKCRHDMRLTLRTSGPGKKYEPELIETIRDGSMNFERFPYGIQQLQGVVRWTGDLVEFGNLSGTHDGAKLLASGTFRRTPNPGRLDLSIVANDAAFDESLRLALPATLRDVWKEFHPKGDFNVRTQMTWVPGEPCEVRIPNVKVRNGEILMTCFPWPLQNLQGEFSFNADPDKEPGKLVISNVIARHDDTQLSIGGIGWFRDKTPWRLTFNQFAVDDLIPNATFRNALPPGIQRVFDTLRPEGSFSFKAFKGPVEFFGPSSAGKSIAAVWNLKANLLNCKIDAGTPIEEMNGEVQLAGQWNGTETQLKGELNLDSVSVLRRSTGQSFQINNITGPILLRDGKFVAGTESAIPERTGEIDPAKRIRGDAIGGSVFVDVLVNLQSETEYQVFMEMDQGRLEQFARRYMDGQSKLAGITKGWMSLRGRGSNSEGITGKGNLRIAPAALYELPVFVQMFRIPQLRVPDRTAFEQAELKFTVGDGRFNFSSIELLGETMSLLGRGFVRFDGAMNLDFGSRPGRFRRRMIPIPFMGAEWVAIRVTGNVGDPRTSIVPFPELDGALRQLLGAVNPQPAMPPGSRFVPRTGQAENLDVQ